MNTTLAEEIRALKRRTELLAPAGRRDVLEAVIEAGADAVYLSGKRFQMRAHRKDYHFDDDALREAVAFAHARNRRVYVTVNTLAAGHELGGLRAYLTLLDGIGVDAVILCDPGVLTIAREIGARFELHASTMMNVHDADQALTLAKLGMDRIVASRDISIGEAGRLGDAAGIGIEYFLHGDMCVAQSGQCSMSGVVLGKSSNRGECMKPCRWQYSLENARRPGESLRQGHLMAIRDLSLVRQIPDLVNAGICALKIEGRMRDAAYLRELTGLYRGMIDRYYALPAGFVVPQDILERLFRLRIRELSTLCANGAPSNSTFFDISGKREPLVLSDGAVEPDMLSREFTMPAFDTPERAAPVAGPELAVCVASPAAAEAALDAGANRIYLAAETAQYGGQQWDSAGFSRAAALTRERNAALGLRTPRVSTVGIRAVWRVWAGLFQSHPPDFILAHHWGALHRARAFFRETPVIADYGFNTLNPAAARLLRDAGAHQVTPAQEAGYEDVRRIAEVRDLPLELIAHGPVEGMIMNHCLIAMSLGRGSSKDMCRGICRHAEFTLRDRKGEVRHIVADQYCRNHLLAAKDLALLPVLDSFLALNAASLRIEAQFYSPDLTGRVTAAYRRALDRWRAGERAAPARPEWESLIAASPRSWNLGGYAQRVTRSASTLEVMRSGR